MSLWIPRGVADEARVFQFMRAADIRITDKNFVHAIGIEQHSFLRALVAYTDFNGRTCQMHIAATPGRPWCTREFLRVIFDYPFHQAKCVEVLAWVNSTNSRMRWILMRLAFRVRYIAPGAGMGNADLLLYSRRRDTVLPAFQRKDHGKIEQAAACA